MTENAPDLLAELATIADPKMAAVNAKHGNAHSVNLTKLRAIAKRGKKDQPLAVELWKTEDANGRLLALLICRPSEFSEAQLDAWLRGANTPKEQNRLVNYVVKKSKHAEPLREAWFADADPVVASAGWALTTERVGKRLEVLKDYPTPPPELHLALCSDLDPRDGQPRRRLSPRVRSLRGGGKVGGRSRAMRKGAE